MEKKSLRGLFRIDSDDYEPYMGKKLAIRGVQLPLLPQYKRKENSTVHYTSGRAERKRGTLITIYGAYRREYRHIDGETFDNHFIDMGVDVIKQTMPQFRKGTRSLNNNRYLVVQDLTNEKDLKEKIGHTIKLVGGGTFRMVYDGLERHCYLCARKHGRECPKRTRFEFLKNLRAGKTAKRKIYSDSIMRHANSLALTTDVACMSGGGIGPIANAIHHD